MRNAYSPVLMYFYNRTQLSQDITHTSFVLSLSGTYDSYANFNFNIGSYVGTNNGFHFIITMLRK